MESPDFKSPARVQTRDVYKTGDEVRMLVNNMTGMASFKQRQIIAEQLGGKSVDAKQPLQLTKLSKHIYSPANTKIGGYTQFPRPLDKPYVNKIDFASEVATKMYLPK
jgi:hypothetical protein